MKLPRLLMIIFFLQCYLPGRSQNLCFSGKDVPLTDIFKIIKCQTGVLFFYDAALLQNSKPITIEWKNVTLEKALNEIFKGQSLTWILEDKTVSIIKKNSVALEKQRGQTNILVRN